LHYFLCTGKYKAGEEAIEANGNDNIEKDRIETRGGAMLEKNFPELPDPY